MFRSKFETMKQFPTEAPPDTCARILPLGVNGGKGLLAPDMPSSHVAWLLNRKRLRARSKSHLLHVLQSEELQILDDAVETAVGRALNFEDVGEQPAAAPVPGVYHLLDLNNLCPD